MTPATTSGKRISISVGEARVSVGAVNGTSRIGNLGAANRKKERSQRRKSASHCGHSQTILFALLRVFIPGFAEMKFGSLRERSP